MDKEQTTVLVGDSLELLRDMPSDCFDCCVTSPPYYGLRDYGVDGQLGLEPTPEEYIDHLVQIFREVRRVLKPEGTLWLNVGDSYAGSGKGRMKDGAHAAGKSRSGVYEFKVGGLLAATKPEGYKRKDLIGIPWMLALALRADGWYLRQDIIWYKPNAMTESVKDRCTKSHEYIFLLSKSEKYYFDFESIKEPCVGFDKSSPRGNAPNEKGTRNRRSVWSIATRGFKDAHFATFPEALVEPCILAGCPESGIVLDPFLGSGTTAVVANKYGRRCVGIELNPDYADIARRRLEGVANG